MKPFFFYGIGLVPGEEGQLEEERLRIGKTAPEMLIGEQKHMGRGVDTLGKCGMNGICVEKYRVSGINREFLLVYGDGEFAGEQMDEFQILVKMGRNVGDSVVTEETAKGQKRAVLTISCRRARAVRSENGFSFIDASEKI